MCPVLHELGLAPCRSVAVTVSKLKLKTVFIAKLTQIETTALFVSKYLVDDMTWLKCLHVTGANMDNM